MMEEFFYWIGVIYSALFALVGLCVFVGLISDYAWSKMKNAYGLMEIMAVWKQHNQEKERGES